MFSLNRGCADLNRIPVTNLLIRILYSYILLNLRMLFNWVWDILLFHRGLFSYFSHLYLGLLSFLNFASFWCFRRLYFDSDLISFNSRLILLIWDILFWMWLSHRIRFVWLTHINIFNIIVRGLIRKQLFNFISYYNLNDFHVLIFRTFLLTFHIVPLIKIFKVLLNFRFMKLHSFGSWYKYFNKKWVIRVITYLKWALVFEIFIQLFKILGKTHSHQFFIFLKYFLLWNRLII